MGRKTKIAVIALALLIIAVVMSFVLRPPMPGSAPPSPDVRPFGNNREWVLTEDMVYVIGDTEAQIVVPKGFVTDFASIPKSLWSFGLSPHGQYSRAAVVHDYLYWAQPCTRDQADRLLVIAMKESSVGGFDEWAIYTAVDKFGGGPWKQNSKEREDGIPKVIPQAHLRPKDPNMSWKEYRSILARQGVRDPAFEIKPEYCKLGDSMLVPTGSLAPTTQTR
jgi:hypothetical protein